MDELGKHVIKRLPKYAVPVFLKMVKRMDRTGTNKPTKATLREQGVNPEFTVDGDSLWWLKSEGYVPFREKEWKELSDGAVKL